MSRRVPVPQPFFATASASESESRLLLLSYRFPPSEEVGALRWQKLTGALAALGWAVDVVTLDPGLLSTRDDRRLAELPPGTRVFGVAPRRLLLERFERLIVRAVHALSRRRTSHAGNGGGPGSIRMAAAGGPLRSFADLRRAYHTLAWHARDAAWARAAAAAAARIAEGSAYRAVVTCGPPHMIHFTAIDLARKLGAPLVLDLRDPWSFVERLPERYASTLYGRIAARYETRAVCAAALVVAATEQFRAELARRYPAAAGRIITVPNGFDAEPRDPAVDSGPFTVAYAGTLYLDRDPRPLLRAAASVVRRESLAPEQFRLLFIGEVARYDGVTLETIAAEEGLAAYIAVLDRLPRQEALAQLACADVLVILQQDSHLAVPAKLYEYMPFPAWILAIADPGSAVAATLAGTAAEVVAPGDIDGIAAAIRRCLERKQRDGRPQPMAASVPHLSRERQAARLVAALARLP